MSNSLILRFAVEADIPRIEHLLYQVHKVHSDARPDIFVPGQKKYTAEDLQAILRDAARPVFVAEDADGTVQGYAFCMVQITAGERNLTDRRVLYLDDLCVDEDARGTHVGSALCRHVMAYAKENGFDSVTLNVWSFNQHAADFYQRMGFTPLKTVLEQKP